MIEFFQSSFAKASRFHWDFIAKFEDADRWQQLAASYAFSGRELLLSSRTLRIPRVIHQIWLGPSPLPSLYQQWGKSWLHYNPGFSYRLWSDHDIDEFGLRNRDLYDSMTNYGARSDLARYEILHRLGGIYVDTDFECVAPIPQAFLAFSFVACLMFNATPELSNGMLMAAPCSSLLREVIEGCASVDDPADMFSILNATGPFLLTRKYFETNAKTQAEMLILPSNYFFPWPNFALDFKGDPSAFVTVDSIGIHHWQTSWFNKPRQGVRYYLKGLVKAIIHASRSWIHGVIDLRGT